MERLKSSTLIKIDLVNVPDEIFRACVHYRFVRFNHVHCLTLDKGIEILEGDRLSVTHLYGLRDRVGAISTDETRLRSKGQKITRSMPPIPPS
jgi:hypothetical protein